MGEWSKDLDAAKALDREVLLSDGKAVATGRFMGWRWVKSCENFCVMEQDAGMASGIPLAFEPSAWMPLPAPPQ